MPAAPWDAAIRLASRLAPEFVVDLRSRNLAAAPAGVHDRSAIDALCATLPYVPAIAIVEHVFGSAPLVEALLPGADRSDAIVRGDQLISSSLFTPSPGLALAAAAAAEPGPQGLVLHGRARSPSPRAAHHLVLAQAPDGAHILCLVATGSPGVDLVASSTDGAGGDGWLRLDGALVAPGESVAVTLAIDGPFAASLAVAARAAAYALWSFADRTVRRCRVALSSRSRDGATEAQVLSLELTRAHIGTALVKAALDDAAGEADPTGGAAFEVLADACSQLTRLAVMAEVVSRVAAVEPGALPPPSLVGASWGGTLMIEGEASRRAGAAGATLVRSL